jgi:SMI1-KNR4 cell-wall
MFGGGEAFPMAEVENSNPHGPLDPARLATFEARLGATLPADYRRFLIAHNGGKLVPTEVVFPGEDEPFADLHLVFGLHDGPHGLESVFNNVRSDIPAEMIAVAEMYGGNLLCVGLRGEMRDKVYYWEHNAPEGLERTVLAGSFDQFLAALGGPQPGA